AAAAMLQVLPAVLMEERSKLERRQQQLVGPYIQCIQTNSLHGFRQYLFSHGMDRYIFIRTAHAKSSIFQKISSLNLATSDPVTKIAEHRVKCAGWRRQRLAVRGCAWALIWSVAAEVVAN